MRALQVDIVITACTFTPVPSLSAMVASYFEHALRCAATTAWAARAAPPASSRWSSRSTCSRRAPLQMCLLTHSPHGI